MGELEKLIDNLIRDVKDPKMKKDLINRLDKASQSKEQPLDDLTDGKLEEIEKLKKKLNKVEELNKSLVTVSKKRFRSTGNPFSGRGKKTEDSRLLSTGAGTGWRGFTEKPKVRETLPQGTEKKPAETFAVSNKQPYGGKAPLSRTISTGVKRDDPDTQGVKDSAAPIQNTSTGQTKPEESKSKESKAKKFLNRLLGRGKKEKPLTSSTAPTPTSTETSRAQSSARPKPDDTTSQTATASTSQIREEPKKKKKEKKQESNEDALKRLKREHEAGKKKREALFSGKKVEKPKEKKGKKGKKKVSIEQFVDDLYRGAPKRKEFEESKQQKKLIDDSIRMATRKPSVISRMRGRKNASLIKAMEEFLEKDASGYGDLGIANVYPLESYNEPSLIGEPVGEIVSPSNISETYIVSRENKGKENEQNNKN